MNAVAERIEAVEREVQTHRRRQSLAMIQGAEWYREMLPGYVPSGFASHHLELIEWIEEVRSGETPRPFFAVWPRGGGKSTLTELAVVKLGATGVCRYVVYTGETQQQADMHVANVATMLESKAIEGAYPEHGERLLSKHGQQRGWRRNRLRTAGGLTVDAYGLDVAARGAKIDEYRPDLIVLDDIDSEGDSPKTTQRKIDLITRALLPAGSADCKVIGVQNLVHQASVFSRLADGRADFLGTRVLSGPIPAVYDLRTERRYDEEAERYRDIITGGVPSWPEGQSLEDCQKIIDRIGLSAFLTECQHEVHEKPGALWNRRMLVNCRVNEPPKDGDGNLLFKRIGIGVDPSGGKAEVGIVAAGLKGSTAYVLKDASVAGALGPRAWATAVVELYHSLQADFVCVERNYGGDMARYTIETVDPSVNIVEVTASRGKALRAEPIAALYGSEDLEYVDSCVHHVGTFPELETEMCGWAPGDDSPNRLDALVWVLTQLMINKRPVIDYSRGAF